MPLEFQTHDWLDEIERQKQEIVDEVAAQISREHPDLFQDKLVGKNGLKAENIVRNAVLTRKDIMPDEVDGIVGAIMGQATGYGPLREFFVGPNAQEITEVMINPSAEGPRVFYGLRGRPHAANKQYFSNDEEVLQYCRKVCEDVGRPFTEDAPIVDAWLKDGSRIAVMGFKASPLGTAATIRKSPLVRPPLPLQAMVENQTLPPLAADILVNLLVKGHANLGVFGRTDSGKTSFLRALGREIDPIERVIIGETSFELAFPNLPNCINLVEVVYGDKKIVSMTNICETINRNNPDRALVGEIRGGEIVAASEIAESTSGGFWTTGHAGGVDELRSRLPKMFYRGGMPLPKEFVDEQIKAMFHFLIFLDKSWDNKRTFMSLVEVTQEGYRTIIKFDEAEFAASQGKTRRWIYENPITEERLGRLAFRGAEIKPEYTSITDKYLYPERKE